MLALRSAARQDCSNILKRVTRRVESRNSQHIHPQLPPRIDTVWQEVTAPRDRVVRSWTTPESNSIPSTLC